MSLVERIKELQELQTVGRGPEVAISPRLQGVLSKSGIKPLLDQLAGLTPVEVSEKLIEEGRKMVITVKWPPASQAEYNQLIVSVRENSVSFIGDHATDQYLRCEGESISDRDKIEECLAQTFVNPAKFETRP